MAQRSREAVVELLRSKPAVELAEIRAVLDDAGRSTAFRYLDQVPYRSSVNYNGRFYTLHDPAKYDRHGLFSVGDIHFSVDGTLRATVVRLVHRSEAGQTQRELQDILQVRVQMALNAAMRGGEIDREPLGRAYLYLHCDPQIRSAQIERREILVAQAEREQVAIDDEVVVRVLLALLRHRGSGPGDVVRRLMGRSPPITLEQVEAVFRRYQLGEKGGPRIF